MQAIWKDAVIAEANQDELVKIEGNWYFPPTAVKQDYLKESDLHTMCVWKGTADYYDLVVDGEVNEGAAWYYPVPKEESVKLVKKDFSNYVAFWRGVEVVS